MILEEKAFEYLSENKAVCTACDHPLGAHSIYSRPTLPRHMRWPLKSSGKEYIVGMCHNGRNVSRGSRMKCGCHEFTPQDEDLMLAEMRT